MSQSPIPPTTHVADVTADDNIVDIKTSGNAAVDNANANDSDSTASEAPKPSPLPTPPIPNARVILMCEQAQDASTQEHQMTIRQSITIYKPAIWICFFWSASVIMQSFNITLIPSFFAQEQFSEKFGILSAEGKYEISAGWRTGLTVGALIGEMIGLVLSGIISEKYGYRKTMIGALIATTGFIFIPFFANSIEALLVGQILGGIPWGMFQSRKLGWCSSPSPLLMYTVPSSYASDIMPQVLRPYLTTYINLCWVFGQLIASIAVRAVLQLDNEWAYRVRTSPLASLSEQLGHRLTSLDSICYPMDMATLCHPRHLIFSRISSVARSERSKGRGPASYVTPHLSQKPKFQCRQRHHVDGRNE